MKMAINLMSNYRPILLILNLFFLPSYFPPPGAGSLTPKPHFSLMGDFGGGRCGIQIAIKKNAIYNATKLLSSCVKKLPISVFENYPELLFTKTNAEKKSIVFIPVMCISVSIYVFFF